MHSLYTNNRWLTLRQITMRLLVEAGSTTMVTRMAGERDFAFVCVLLLLLLLLGTRRHSQTLFWRGRDSVAEAGVLPFSHRVCIAIAQGKFR